MIATPVFAPKVIAAIVHVTGLSLAGNENDKDPDERLAIMLEGNLRTLMDLRSGKQVPTTAQLRNYFEKVEKAAAGLVKALGMSVPADEDEPPPDSWAQTFHWEEAANQTWAVEWQRIENPPDHHHQLDINRPLFRVLREARRQQAKTENTQSTPGRKPDYVLRWLIADLMGIFEVAFGRRAGKGRSGPFPRFALAVCDRINKVVMPPMDLSVESIFAAMPSAKSRK